MSSLNRLLVVLIVKNKNKSFFTGRAMKYYPLLALLAVSHIAVADMQVMSEEELQSIDGQSGADLSLEMRLNQKADYSFDTDVCTPAKIEYCRFATSLNNRSKSTGEKLWLVFKQVQGTIKFQEIKLDAVDLTPYVGDNSATVQKAAIQLGFDSTKPILIRNFGYQSLAIESDTVPNEGAGNLPGYLATGTYATAGFDNGREVGFTGLNINGNLALKATLKIFSCDANHPRC